MYAYEKHVSTDFRQVFGVDHFFASQPGVKQQGLPRYQDSAHKGFSRPASFMHLGDLTFGMHMWSRMSYEVRIFSQTLLRKVVTSTSWHESSVVVVRSLESKFD